MSNYARQYDRLAILHVPRTAGTAITSALLQNIAPGESAGQAMISSVVADRWASIDLLRDKKLVIAHFHHGLLRALRETHICGATLRDPIDRAISVYRWWRGYNIKLVEYEYQLKLVRMAKEQSFKDFILSPDAQYLLFEQTLIFSEDNLILVNYAGEKFDERMLFLKLEKAKQNISNLHFIVVDFDFYPALSWYSLSQKIPEPSQIPNINSSPDVGRCINLSAQEKEQIERFAKYDKELVTVARQKVQADDKIYRLVNLLGRASWLKNGRAFFFDYGWHHMELLRGILPYHWMGLTEAARVMIRPNGSPIRNHRVTIYKTNFDEVIAVEISGGKGGGTQFALVPPSGAVIDVVVESPQDEPAELLFFTRKGRDSERDPRPLSIMVMIDEIL